MGLPILDKAEQNAREQGRKLSRDYDTLDAGSIGVALALLEQCQHLGRRISALEGKLTERDAE